MKVEQFISIEDDLGVVLGQILDITSSELVTVGSFLYTVSGMPINKDDYTIEELTIALSSKMKINLYETYEELVENNITYFF